MNKQQYLTPEADVLLLVMEGRFLGNASGENMDDPGDEYNPY